MLGKATEQFRAGNDEAATESISKILVKEPMSAESYMLLGKRHLRRWDLEQALNAFKTALFWKNGIVEGHIFLARIFLQKGDCLQAKNYARSAIEIGPDDPEAAALQRQIERCSP